MTQTSPSYTPRLLAAGLVEAACTCGWRTNKAMSAAPAASAWRAHCAKEHP